MAEPRATAAQASVVFLKISQFAQRPVAEQARLKGLLERVVQSGSACLRGPERIVLEAADGAAVVVLGNPAAALEFARRSTAGEAGADLAAGISHGPVRVTGTSTAPMVLGDGLVAADAVAGFAPRGRIAATRDFREALKRAMPGDVAQLVHAGTRNDARDRSYEVFLADQAAGAARDRRVWAVAGAIAAAVLALGIAARWGLFDSSPAAQAVKPAAPANPLTNEKPAAPFARDSAPGSQPLAIVRLDIRPRGEILIDGVAKGTSPPLASIQIAPGKHRIEIRHGRSTPLVLQVHAGPGEELSIKHTFVPPPQPQPKPAWRRWLDQLK